MKLLCLIILIISASLSASAVELSIKAVNEKSEAECVLDKASYGSPETFKRCGAVTYFLIGPCEDAALEILKMNPQENPVCECSNSECRTVLTPHLPKNMQALLKSPHPHDEMLNCYNTLLHSLGFNIGYYQSSQDTKLLIASPFCKRRSGRPQPGDVIWVDGHGYFALTDNIAFNKSNPGNEQPYEVITIDDYFREQKFDLSCQFIEPEEARAKNCEVTTSAYTCNIPESLRTSTVLGPVGKELMNKYDDCGYRGSVLGEKIEENLDELNQQIKKMALAKIGFPGLENTDPALIESMKKAFMSTNDEADQIRQNAEYFETNKQDFMMLVYLAAAPDMKLDSYLPETRKVIETARSQGYFSKLPAEERIGWGMLNMQQIPAYLPY